MVDNSDNSSMSKKNVNERPNSIEGALDLLEDALAGPAADIKELVGEDLQGLFTQARDVYRKVDDNLRSNPWPAIGGVAVGTFALGFVLAKGMTQGERL